MPPKKQEPSKKTTEKQKQKIIEDKTFGLKNKKGKKQQQFVKNVAQQVKGQSYKQQELEKAKKKEKLAELEELKELKTLFKPVVAKQKVEHGVDPKSVLCAYFKQGACTRGDKCKFSHDLTMERRQEKKDLFTDSRDVVEEHNNVNMEDMDQASLEALIDKKHGQSNANRTEIVCKYFIEAVEKKLYGWFWTCPNGGDSCQYRHALPPGYILKRDVTPKPHVEEISIEEYIERERENLVGELTPVTLESFSAWKEKKIKEKKEAYEKEVQQKKLELLSGRIVSRISGKEAFSLDPNLIKQDDDEANDEGLEFESHDPAEYEGMVSVDVSHGTLIGLKKVDDERCTRMVSLHPKDRMLFTAQPTNEIHSKHPSSINDVKDTPDIPSVPYSDPIISGSNITKNEPSQQKVI